MTLPIARVIAQNARRTNLNNYVFPEDIGAHGIIFMFRQYEYSTSKQTMSNVSGRLTESVVLPLPVNLEDNLAIRIQRFDQGVLGEAISRAAEAGADAMAMGSLGAGMDAFQQRLRELMPTGTDIGNLTNAALGGELPSETVTKLSFIARSTLDKLGMVRNVDAGLGTTTNPKAALYFEGVDFKTHSFNWNFMPRSARESEMLKNILTTMRKHSLPTYIDVVSADSGIAPLQRAMFRYPSIVEMKLLGVDESHYMKFKPCMIQQINYNFAPQGQAVLKGGKPAAVNVNLSLIETDIWTRHDYDPNLQRDEQLDSDLYSGTTRTYGTSSGE